MDDIILEPLGKEVLKFQSVKAFKFFSDAKDSHKSWQRLQILLIGTTLELIKQFKQESSEQDHLKFLSWLSEDVNPSIRLAVELIVNFTLAAYIFKSRVRANDVTAVNEGRLKFMHSIILFTEKLSITIYVIVFPIRQRRQYVT